MKTASIRILFLLVLLSTAWRPLRADDISRRVDDLVAQVTPATIAWRRDFHAHPELSGKEERTSRVVAEQLRAMGIKEIKTGVGGHGVVALIRGRRPGPTVALRADMDALPIHEETGLPFASKNDGVMHACGHDAHTAMLLGAARVLVQLRDVLPGTVKLIFQPAEESEGGAQHMIEAGVLRNPDVKAIFALHVRSELPTRQIGYRYGGITSGVDFFRVTITGKQSHAAKPWQGVDPIVTTAHVITALQTIVSRRVDAHQPAVVSIGILKAGTAWNIIPGSAMFEGTVRTCDPDVRREVAADFRRIVEQTALAHGAKAEITYVDYGPSVINDPKLGARMKPSLVRAAGEKNVVEIEQSTGGEDFAGFTQKLPGFYVYLGVHNESIGATYGLHSSHFKLDEAALPTGVRALVFMAMDYLAGESPRSQ